MYKCILNVKFILKSSCINIKTKFDNLLFSASNLLGAMDRTVDPCVDFFQFACGSWNKKHVIPEDKSSINVFDVLSDQLHVILKGKLKRYLFFNWCYDYH